MKETVNVNIGSVAFTLDEDAYLLLNGYFDDIRSRLPEGDSETMADIERRVAEIFRERVSSPMRVITLETVRATMAQMGSPSDFGERRTPEDTPHDDTEMRSEPRNSIARVRSDRSPASAAVWVSSSTQIRQ